jgi:putative acetyltransferase
VVSGSIAVDRSVIRVSLAEPGDPQVAALLDALTSEMALEGYTTEQTFGYTAEQLLTANVYLVGARVHGRLAGVGGLERQGNRVGELKRFYVTPEHRGTGVADAVLDALLDHAQLHDLDLVRLETGNKQHAAIAFYRRHGFTDVARFGPYLFSETSVCMERRLPRRPMMQRAPSERA